MNAEILTIGDEILIGQITNTNSVWIAQQLNQMGIKVVHMASVADDETAIIKAFDASLLRANFVFITGGLGPTKDDITKKTIAKYFDVALVISEEVLQDVTFFFLKRGKDLSPLNRNQALVPEGSTVFRNPHGTAPAMWLQKQNTVFISMPGVPFEMKAFMTDAILPKIKNENTLPFIYHKTVLTNGIGESALAELIEPWEDNLINNNIKLAYLPQPGIVRLRLSSYGSNLNELKNNIETEIESLKKIINKYIYGYENYGEETPSLEKIVSQLLKERGETISLAESCTGGYVSSLFVALAGASDVFKGGIIPYTNTAKQQLLQVDEQIFKDFGAVSKQCVQQLAQNVLKKFNSTYGIATSGVAGPTGGTYDKPIGTVWIAVATNQKCLALKFQFGDNRQRNIVMTSHTALNMLRKIILKEDSI